MSMAEMAYALASSGRAAQPKGMKPKQYWFPAKRYGWGWGPPCAWQGWVVTALFIALQVGGAFLILGVGKKVPPVRLGGFIVYSCVLATLLVWVCWLKGEKPAWRWGDRE